MGAGAARGHVDLALVNVRRAIALYGRESGWEAAHMREVQGTLTELLKRLRQEQERDARAVLPGDAHA